MKAVTIEATYSEDARAIAEEWEEDLTQRDGTQIRIVTDDVPGLLTFIDDNDVLTDEIEIRPEGEWPKEGTVYFHNDGADAVECQQDFSDLEHGSAAYQRLKSWMYEVGIEVRLTEDGEIEVLDVDHDGQ